MYTIYLIWENVQPSHVFPPEQRSRDIAVYCSLYHLRRKVYSNAMLALDLIW